MTITFADMMIEFLSQYKSLTFIYALTLILSPIQDIGIPHVIGKIVNTLNKEDFQFKYIIYLMGLLFIGQITISLNDCINAKFLPVLQTFLGNKIVNYVINTCKYKIQDVATAKIISALAACPTTIYNFLDSWKNVLVPQAIVAGIAVIYFAYYNIVLGIIIFLMLVAYYVLFFLTLIDCGNIAMDRESYFQDVNEEMDDLFTNLMTAFNSNTITSEKNRIMDYFKDYEDISTKALWCSLKYKYLILPVIFMLGLVFVYTSWNMVQKNKLDTASFISILLIFISILGGIMKSINIVKEASVRWGKIKQNISVFNLLEESSMVQCSKMTEVINQSNFIVFDKLYVEYNNKKVFDDFTLSIPKGRKLLIIGHAGKGKTTLLKVLMRYHQPTKGAVYIDGVCQNDIPVEILRSKIGFIPQNPILLNRTLYENIVYGHTHVNKGQVLELIDKLKLSHIFDANRLDMKVGKHGSKLSGGQRQVVLILRVIIQNPDIILMDEPTASIDNETKAYIMDLFKVVMQGRTVIIVSHDMSLAQLCDEIITLA